MTRSRTAWSLAFILLLLAGGCERETDTSPAGEESGAPPATAAPTSAEPAAEPVGPGELPEPDLSRLSIRLQMKIGAVQQALRNDPTNLSHLGELGALYYAQGYPAAAIAVFKQAIAVEDTDYSPWYIVGRAYEQLGNRAEARNAYEKALARRAQALTAQPEEKRQPYPPLNVRLAALLIETQPKRAAELLQQLLDVQPNDPVALAGLGLCARAQNRLAEAEAHLRHALALAPGYVFGHRELAAVLTAQGREEEAKPHRERGGTEEPLLPAQDPLERNVLRKGWELNTVLSDAAELGRAGNLDDAEKVLEIARDIDPTGTHVRNGLAMLKYERGQYESAAREFRALMEEYPDFLVAKSNLALALAALDKPDEAERLLAEVLDADPTEGLTLERFTKLMVSQNRAADALTRIRRARDARPEDPQTQLSTGILLHALGALDEAAAALEKAVALEPLSARAHLELGAVRRAQGNVADARESWTTALELAPALVPARMALFSILHEERDYEAAEQLLREGIPHAPQSLELANALAWCLATSPIEEQRDPNTALQLAQKFNEATNFSNASLLDTLAAACAAAGQYDKAREWIAQAIKLAESAGRPDAVAEYSSRAALYQQDQPFREPPR